jgi:HSP20 family molecular chaperone IbpA
MSGYEIEEVICKPERERGDEINEARDELRSEIAAAVASSENLSDSEANKLQGDFSATEGEKLALKKHQLLSPFPGVSEAKIEVEVKDEAGEIKIEERPLASAELIERLLYKDRDLARKFERRYWLENIDDARKHQRQKWIKSCERALDPDKPRSLNLSKWRSDLLAAIALRDLGLHHFLAPGFEWDAKSSEVISLYSLIRKSKRIQRDLNFQPDLLTPLDIVGRLLKRIGVSAKSKRLRIDGKPIRRYSLAPASLIDEQLQAAVSARLQAKNADTRTTKNMIELSQLEVIHLNPDLLTKEGLGGSATLYTPQGLEGDFEGHTRDDNFSPQIEQNEPQNEPTLLPVSEPIAPQIMSAHERVQAMLERDRLAYLARFEVSPSMI